MVYGLVASRVLILLELHISLVEAIGDPFGCRGCPCELGDDLHVRGTRFEENLEIQLACQCPSLLGCWGQRSRLPQRFGVEWVHTFLRLYT